MNNSEIKLTAKFEAIQLTGPTFNHYLFLMIKDIATNSNSGNYSLEELKEAIKNKTLKHLQGNKKFKDDYKLAYFNAFEDNKHRIQAWTEGDLRNKILLNLTKAK